MTCIKKFFQYCYTTNPKHFFTELLIVLNIAKYYLFKNKFLKH